MINLTNLSIIIGSTGVGISIIAVVIACYFAYLPNKIRLSLGETLYEDAKIINNPSQPMARFFHIKVENTHKNKDAKNCKAYVVSLRVKSTNKELLNSELPLKWRGYPTAVLDIQHKKFEKFDAFHVEHSEPDRILFNAYIDSTALIPVIKMTDELIVKYRVTADGFKSKEKEFIIVLDKTLVNVTTKDFSRSSSST